MTINPSSLALTPSVELLLWKWNWDSLKREWGEVVVVVGGGSDAVLLEMAKKTKAMSMMRKV
ncbi:hypothetical protein GYH30_041587 [Glycine max]|nr:hypothetical protein GYH30_041587 [Glycine max]